MDNPSVTILLVNYRNAPDTRACLESLRPYWSGDRPTARVLVVDNASGDGSAAGLRAWMAAQANDRLTLLEADANRGFAAGNNLGIRYALKHHDPAFLWLLNNDTVAEAGCLEALLAAAAARPQVRIWGSTVFDYDPPHRLQCAGGFRYNALLSVPSPILFPPEALPTGLYHPLPQLDYVAGISMFVRAAAFRRYGLMDESYFLYYEELDLTRQFGGKAYLAWCPDSRLRHRGGGSTGSHDPNRGRGSATAHYYGNRNALRYTWRYHRRYFPVVFLFRLAAKSVLFVRYGDWEGFRGMGRGYRDFWRKGREGRL